MPRWLSRSFPLLVLGLLIPLGSLAQTAPVPSPDHPRHFHRLRRCLAILDLTEDQKTSIQTILEAAKPILQADAEAVHVARETLRADAGAVPPDACLVGNDFLALRTAQETLQGEFQSVRDQILAQLTPEQQSRLEGCLEAPRWDLAPTTDAAPGNSGPADIPPLGPPVRMN
jgi:Spy/CpxP family protein refolding chaperone